METVLANSPRDDGKLTSTISEGSNKMNPRSNSDCDEAAKLETKSGVCGEFDTPSCGYLESATKNSSESELVLNTSCHREPAEKLDTLDTGISALNRDHFANVFIRDWRVAVQRVDHGRRVLSSLQNYLRERADLEEAYSNGLRKIASLVRIPTGHTTSSVAAATSAIVNNTTRRADQAREFAESIRSDIIGGTVSVTVANHAAVIDEITNDAKTVTALFSKAIEDVQKMEKHLRQVGKGTLKLCCEAQLVPSNQLPRQQLRLAERTLASAAELSLVQARYEQSVELANKNGSGFVVRMQPILSSLEDMDYKRLACYKDALRKLSVYQAAYLRNCQYDIAPAVEAIEAMSEIEDISDFLRQSRENLGLPPFSSMHEQPEATNGENLGSEPPGAKQLDQTTASLPFPKFQQRDWITLCLSPIDVESPIPMVSHEGSKAPNNVSGGAEISLQSLPINFSTGSTVGAAAAMAQHWLRSAALPLDSVFQNATNAHHPFHSLWSSRMGISKPVAVPNIQESRSREPCQLGNMDSKPAATPLDGYSKRSTRPLTEVIRGLLDTPAEQRSCQPQFDDVTIRELGSPTTAATASAKTAASYDSLLESIWSFDAAVENAKAAALRGLVNRLQDELSSSWFRNAMCKALERQFSKGNYQLASIDGLQLLGVVASTMLEWAERQWDVPVGRSLLIFCQKFFAYGKPTDDPQAPSNSNKWSLAANRTERQSPKDQAVEPGEDTTSVDPSSSSENAVLGDAETTTPKHAIASSCSRDVPWFLHRAIYHLILWNRVPFWEECLILTIAEFLQRQLLRQVRESIGESTVEISPSDTTHPTTESSLLDLACSNIQEDLLGNLLRTFGTCMIAFGIQSDQALLLIRKVCMQHRVDPDTSRQLLGCIDQRANEEDTATSVLLPLAPFKVPAHPTSDAWTAQY